MTPDDATELGGDLWGAPQSAQPADIAGHLPGPTLPVVSRPAPGNAERFTREARHGRLPGKGMSLVIAMALLIGLGFAAQRLDPSRGAATSSSGTVSTQNQAPAASPSATPAPSGGAAAVMTGGPPYCPMQAAGLDCFFIG